MVQRRTINSIKKLIYTFTFFISIFHVQSQVSSINLLQSKNWKNVSSRQLSSLKIKHDNYDLILMPEDKVDMFWGDVIKLDSLNNYRAYRPLKCGTPPYSKYNITGKWQVSGNKLCINIQSAILDCTYGEEKCIKLKQKFLKRKEEHKIEYTLKVLNDSLIVGIKINDSF